MTIHTCDPALDSDTHLHETLQSRETLFEGRFLTARRDTVSLPDGGSASREYVVHPGAVVVIPFLDPERIVLERQYRYPVGRVMTEFPAGKLDAGEDPLVCAQRELLEETGYTAGQWAHVGAMHLAIAYSTEIIHIYAAKDLRAGQRKLDEGEFLDVFTASVTEFLENCRNGAVTDAKTLSCALWLQNIQSGVWTLDWKALS